MRLVALCGGGLLLLLFTGAGALAAEPVVTVMSDALHIVAAPEDGSRIVAVDGGEVFVRNLFTLAIVAKMPTLERSRTAAAISGDGNIVAVGDGSGSFSVWRVAEPPIKVANFKHRSGITDLQLSHDGRQVAVVSANGLVVRAVDGSRSWVLPVAPPRSFQLSPDGRQITADGKSWDIASRRRLEPPRVDWTDTAFHRSAEPPPFVSEEFDDSPDRRFELGDWLVTLKRQQIDDGKYCVLRLCNAEPFRQRAVLLFDDEGWEPSAKQQARIVDGQVTIVTWDATTMRRWVMQLPEALAAGEEFAVARPVSGQWQGVERWNPQRNPLAELQRLRDWPTPRVADDAIAGHVNFSGSLLRDDDLAQLARVKGLTSLRLEGWQFDNSSLAKLQSLPALERLVIGDGCRVDHEGLRALAAMPKLATLELERAAPPTAWFAALRSCRHLRVLRTRCPPQEEAFAEILQMPQLEELPALDCCLRAEHFNQLKRMTSLRTLKFGRAQLSGGQFEALSGLPHLESLSMQVDIDVQQADALGLMKGVRRVLATTAPMSFVLPEEPRDSDTSTAQPATINRRSLAPLARFAQLKRLRLTGSGVTNYGMQHVASLPHLRELDLSGCTNVSDDGLLYLAKLSALRSLRLEETSVSTTGVDKFKKAMPKCAVSW